MFRHRCKQLEQFQNLRDSHGYAIAMYSIVWHCVNRRTWCLANTEVRRATAAPAPSRAVLATTPANASGHMPMASVWVIFWSQNSVTSHEMVRIGRMIPYMHEYYIHGTVGWLITSNSVLVGLLYLSVPAMPTHAFTPTQDNKDREVRQSQVGHAFRWLLTDHLTILVPISEKWCRHDLGASPKTPDWVALTAVDMDEAPAAKEVLGLEG